MITDKAGESAQRRAVLKAYISESLDREMNTFFIAAICDEEKAEIIEELSDYGREELEKAVGKKYPGIVIESD